MKQLIIIMLIVAILLLVIKLYQLGYVNRTTGKLENEETFINEFNFEFDKNKKLKLYDSCKFSGIGFNDDHELGECSIALQIIPLVKNVLEIGGGAGKVSHKINSVLKEKNLSHKHIVIEPGEGGVGNHKDNIYKNKEKFNDNYTIIKKYAEDLTKTDLKLLDYIPDCLYVDCEGCLHKFFDSDIGKYCLEKSRFLINENDSFVINQNQQDLRDKLTLYKFKKIAIGYGCGVKCDTEVWFKND